MKKEYKALEKDNIFESVDYDIKAVGSIYELNYKQGESNLVFGEIDESTLKAD